MNTERNLVYTEFFKGVLGQFVFPIRGGSCTPQVSAELSDLHFFLYSHLQSESVKALPFFRWEGVREELALLIPR